MRPLVRIDQLWTLATTWYSTRLQENSRRPQPDEMRAIFAGLGLEVISGIQNRIASVNLKFDLAKAPLTYKARIDKKTTIIGAFPIIG